MNKKLIFTILLISILSISLMHMGAISAKGIEIQFDTNDLNDVNVIQNEDEGIYDDYDYVDVNYSTNTNNNPFNRFFYGDTVDIYFDGQGTSVSNNFDSNVSYALSYEVLDFVSDNINNSTMDVEEMKEGV